MCSGPQRGGESSSQLGSNVGSRGRLGRHTEVCGGTAEEPHHCRHALAEAIAPYSPVVGLGAPPPPRSARSPRPGWCAAGQQRLGRGSRPSAQVEVESDRGQGVADGVQCVVRGDQWDGMADHGIRRDTTAEATANTTGQRWGASSGDQSDPALARSPRRSRLPAPDPVRAPEGRRLHERLVARIQRAGRSPVSGLRSAPSGRSRNEAPQHHRPRPERVETTCTDWHLPPTAKGASRQRPLTMQRQPGPAPRPGALKRN